MAETEDRYGDDPFHYGEQGADEFREELVNRGLLNGSKSIVGSPEAREGARAVQTRKGTGKFIKPQQNSWAAHRELVRDRSMRLYFNSEAYPWFDDIITQRINYRPVWDSKDRRFEGYNALRENISIVRNYIMCEFFPDGSVDAEDIKKVRHMAQIAEFLAEGMNNDTLLGRLNPFTTRISIAKANLPGTGAQYLYSKILKKQNYYNWMAPVLWPVYLLTGKTWPKWQLPSLANSAFSDQALRMPPPPEELSKEELAEQLALAQTAVKDSRAPEQMAQTIDALADDFTHAHQMVSGIETLQEPTRRDSIDIAKDILRKLKLVMGTALIESGLSVNSNTNVTILEALKGAVNIYTFHLNKLLTLDPHISANPAVVAANNAIGMLGYIARRETLHIAQKTGNQPLAASTRQLIEQMPAEYKAVKGTRFSELFDKLESGLNTVLMRINQVGDRDTGTDYWLGYSNAKTLGGQNPAILQQDSSQQAQKAMADNAYYQQINMQRNAQQTMVAQQEQMQQGGREQTGANATSRSPLKQQTATPAKVTNTSMSGLISKDAANLMRQSMACDPNTKAVQISRRAAMMEKIRKQQMKVVEQTSRSNERAHDQLQHQHEVEHQQQLAAHRKQHTLGI